MSDCKTCRHYKCQNVVVRDTDGICLNSIYGEWCREYDGFCKAHNANNKCKSWKEQTILQEIGTSNLVVMFCLILFIQLMPLIFEM
jgi:hypothetical protein